MIDGGILVACPLHDSGESREYDPRNIKVSWLIQSLEFYELYDIGNFRNNVPCSVDTLFTVRAAFL